MISNTGATYRHQFNQRYSFEYRRYLLPNLSEHANTDMYSSPPYNPRLATTHGYHISKPLKVNSERAVTLYQRSSVSVISSSWR